MRKNYKKRMNEKKRNTKMRKYYKKRNNEK